MTERQVLQQAAARLVRAGDRGESLRLSEHEVVALLNHIVRAERELRTARQPAPTPSATPEPATLESR